MQTKQLEKLHLIFQKTVIDKFTKLHELNFFASVFFMKTEVLYQGKYLME